VQTARGCAAHLPAVHLGAPGDEAATGMDQRCMLARPLMQTRPARSQRPGASCSAARHGRTGAHPQGPVDRAAGARGNPGRAARVGRRGRRARHEEQARLRRAQRLLRLHGRQARSAAARQLGPGLLRRSATPQPQLDQTSQRHVPRTQENACAMRRWFPRQSTPPHAFTRRKRTRRPACAFAARERCRAESLHVILI